MSRVDIKQALQLVETLGLAPLARIHAQRPRSYKGWSEWSARVRDVERYVAAKLAEHGAIVLPSEGGRPASISFAGIKSTSTGGLTGALNNWKARAAAALTERGSAQ